MLFLAWQVGLKVWRTGTQLFLPVGHSHNEVDQRFPAVALALARAEVLQTPQAQGGHVADLRMRPGLVLLKLVPGISGTTTWAACKFR